VAKAVGIIQQAGSRIGLDLNVLKTKVWLFGRDSSELAFHGMPRITEDGTRILGLLVGLPSYANDFLIAKVNDCKSTLAKAAEIDEPQYLLPLLRYCLGFSKVNHIIRFCSPSDISLGLRQWDQMIYGFIKECFVEQDLSPQDRLEWSLPVRFGGMGITNASNIAWSAHVGSLAQACRVFDDLIVKAESALDKWNSIHGGSEPISFSTISTKGHPQSFLSTLVHKQTIAQLSSEDRHIHQKHRLRFHPTRVSGLW
jgi:hypothetical protein